MAVGGLPIVTVVSGGLAVTEAGARGAPVVEALNGLGTPVTFVLSGGVPVTKVAPDGTIADRAGNNLLDRAGNFILTATAPRTS